METHRKVDDPFMQSEKVKAYLPNFDDDKEECFRCSLKGSCIKICSRAFAHEPVVPQYKRHKNLPDFRKKVVKFCGDNKKEDDPDFK